jgi:hypothetical protein
VGLAIAAIVYLATYGARTPLLALRALLRRRNLALILVPAAAIGAVALLLQGRVDERVAVGAIALAVVPAPFIAPELIGRMRGRADTAGALLLGTLMVSVLVIGSRGALAAGALFTATEAFAVPAMFANALPTMRDRALVPIRVLGWIALVAIFAGALATALPPLFDRTGGGTEPLPILPSLLVAAAMFVAGTASTAVTARVVGGNITAAIGGAGLRDPALAVVLATVIGGPGSTGVPLLYAVFCLVLAAFAFRPR